MNSMGTMKDPAAGVAPQLLPHMHLTSKNRYPITNNPSLETIVGYLLEAPKIVRDLQPMQWQYLDAPADGTVLLAWQPLEYLGTNFASDGYVWADPEQTFKSDVRGYTLEMFHQRAGFRMQGEAVASHSRRRYRLLPGNPNMPHPDPSLFIVHYSKAHARDTIPAASIPIMPQVQQIIQQRRLIQAQGALARKDFMLHDRSNWPTINAPQGVARGQIPGAGHRRGGSLGVNEATLEEEEDVSRGDILDFMTPRDISRMRYEQHHEWMEEILESPYNVYQIVPGDLGLGRKGELEELTKDFFDAPTAAARETENSEPARVGKLESGKARDFNKRASEKIAAMQAELEQMKARHAKRMQRLQRTTMLNSAERKLRSVPTSLNARSMSNGDTMDQDENDALDDIADEVETALGKKIERVQNVTVVSKGGLDERAVNNRTMSTSSATRPMLSPVKASASPNVPQAMTQQSPSSQQVPASTSQPDTTMTNEQSTEQPESTDTPDGGVGQMDGGNDPQPESGAEEQQDEDQEEEEQQDEDQQDTEMTPMDDVGMDVDISDLVNDQADEQEEGGEGDGSEWVMVNDQTAPEVEEAIAADDQPEEETEVLAQTETEKAVEAQPPSAAEEQASVPENPTEQQDETLPTETNDFDLEADFDNVDVDTAGDALASYDNENPEDEELNLDTLDDSAFGDAFHPEDEAQDTPGLGD